ncbi:MAG: hypothetical protein ACLQF2_19565 [Rhodomicrobium sp.]
MHNEEAVAGQDESVRSATDRDAGLGTAQSAFDRMFKVTEEQERRHEQLYLVSLSAGMGAWLLGLKTIQSSVDEWAQKRQETISRGIRDLMKVMSDSGTEDKPEQVANILTNQWESFTKDIIAAQVKTATKLAAFAGHPQFRDMQSTLTQSLDSITRAARETAGESE